MTDIVERLWDASRGEPGLALDAAVEIKLLRAAAERVIWFDWSGNDPDAVAAIDELRRVLAS